MTKKKHVEGEQKPAAASLQALRVWLDANGLRRVALAAPLGANQMQLSRVLAGSGYLTATQRRAIEKFTKGAITVAMLEGSLREELMFDAGFAHGHAAGRSESVKSAPETRSLSAVLRDFAIQDGCRREVALAALLEAAWALLTRREPTKTRSTP